MNKIAYDIYIKSTISKPGIVRIGIVSDLDFHLFLSSIFSFINRLHNTCSH